MLPASAAVSFSFKDCQLPLAESFLFPQSVNYTQAVLPIDDMRSRRQLGGPVSESALCSFSNCVEIDTSAYGSSPPVCSSLLTINTSTVDQDILYLIQLYSYSLYGLLYVPYTVLYYERELDVLLSPCRARLGTHGPMRKVYLVCTDGGDLFFLYPAPHLIYEYS